MLVKDRLLPGDRDAIERFVTEVRKALASQKGKAAEFVLLREEDSE